MTRANNHLINNTLPPGWHPSLSVPPDTQDAKRWAWIVHILYIASFFAGITSIPGVIVAYLKRRDALGTIYESHFTYAIRTFWLGLIFAIVTTTLCFVLVGYAILPFFFIWWLIRVIRPVVALMDNRPIANPTGFF